MLRRNLGGNRRFSRHPRTLRGGYSRHPEQDNRARTGGRVCTDHDGSALVASFCAIGDRRHESRYGRREDRTLSDADVTPAVADGLIPASDHTTDAPMLVSEYLAFVGRTDLSDGWERRFDVALYGLVGELGSVAAAVKKRLLVEGRADWNIPNDEIVEEIGDSLWYCFALAAASGLNGFLKADLAKLSDEISADTPRAARLREVLGA